MLVVYFKLLRVKQWIKNLLIFAPLFFSKNLFNFEKLFIVIIAFFVFSLFASCVYIINDIIDKEKDKKHPIKQKRPIASGKIKISQALVVMVILFLLSTFLIFYFNLKLSFTLVVLVYLVINILYSLILKHIVIIDAIVVAFGFLLRLEAGSMVVDIKLSSWILLCTFFATLFIAFAKRLNELYYLVDNSSHHRKVLDEYTIDNVKYFLNISAVISIISYIMYIQYLVVQSGFKRNIILISIIFVLYGFFRFLYIFEDKKRSLDPTEVFLKDLPTIINSLLFIIVLFMSLYVK